MRKVVGFIQIVLCYATTSAAASYCYPDYCQNLTNLIPTPGFQCVLTRVQIGEDCVKLQFDDVNHATPKESRAEFLLSAYVKDFGQEYGTVATAFNFSVVDANFHSLVTRYQSLRSETEAACRHIKLYGNETHDSPKELYVSCPFSYDYYESFPYRLEFLVTGETFNYSKQYIFTVPLHRHIGEFTTLREYTPFVYIDVSDAPVLSLYVQSYPERYNVRRYKVWLVNNDSDSTFYVEIAAAGDGRHTRYNFTVQNAVYYIKVAAEHPDCGEYGCANSTTPLIVIRGTSHRLLIMIISTVWIPPVMFFALYHIYKLYKRRVFRRPKRPNCLLIYSPTRLTHIHVMTDLAKFLRGCDINATVDTLDVVDVNKDAEVWCTAAFRSADIILVAASPSPKEPATESVYQTISNHFFRLLKENYPLRDKRYYALQFSYCKVDSLPEDARHFKQFSLPKELMRLIKAIHNSECPRCPVASDKDFLDSVQLAKLELLDEDISTARGTEETDGLLASGLIQDPTGNRVNQNQSKVSTDDAVLSNAIPESFRTNIDELNLLGESGDNEGKTFVYKPSTNYTEFCIDELNL